jgi:hypothetical protein
MAFIWAFQLPLLLAYNLHAFNIKDVYCLDDMVRSALGPQLAFAIRIARHCILLAKSNTSSAWVEERIADFLPAA